MSRLYSFRVLSLLGLAASGTFAEDTRRITLTEAVHLAVTQNRALKIARLKVLEEEQKKAGERSAFFPQVSTQTNLLGMTELQNIELPAGALGVAGGGLVPSRTIRVEQGNNRLFSSGTQITQPLTQLIRIHAANQVAAADVAVSRANLKNAENQVALQAHALYYGILIARLQKQAAEQQARDAVDNLRESEEAVRNGAALRVAAIQGRAGVLESQQTILTADLQVADLTTELNDLLGLPLDTKLDLDPAVPASFVQAPKAEYVQAAWEMNPETLAAEEVIRKAHAGVKAAKSAYIPDVTAFARQSYQDGVPFIVHNFGTFGVNMSWDVFDFGKRRAAVRQRVAQLAPAGEDTQRLQGTGDVEIERRYDK